MFSLFRQAIEGHFELFVRKSRSDRSSRRHFSTEIVNWRPERSERPFEYALAHWNQDWQRSDSRQIVDGRDFRRRKLDGSAGGDPQTQRCV